MNTIKILSFAALAFLFAGCLETESKNHPPYEATSVQTPEQKIALKKLVKKAEANYHANKGKSTH